MRTPTMHLHLWSWREQCVCEQPCTSVPLCFCLASLPGTTGLSNKYRLQSEAQQHLGCFLQRDIQMEFLVWARSGGGEGATVGPGGLAEEGRCVH